jgi:pimeloyl-ACP methyl ester carboxylesterase
MRFKHVFRTRLGCIVAEYLPPARKTRGRQKVVILCDGMPTMPQKHDLLRFLSRQGFWVFHPRYRGTWESDGIFLAESLERDVFEVMYRIGNGFADSWSGERTVLPEREYILLGSSFGGAAALLASGFTGISRVIVFSPLVDWTAESKAEPIDVLARFTEEAFGRAYQIHPRTWGRLKTGMFFNPMCEVARIKGAKVLIVHAKDDKVILPKPVQRFAKLTKSRLVMLKRGGHMGLNTIMRLSHWNRIKKFIA